MLEPQSVGTFLLVLVAFGVLMWRTLAARHLALRVTGAAVALIPGMALGILAVNAYYDYYQTWGAAVADLGNQAGAPPAGALQQVRGIEASPAALARARTAGVTLRVDLPGPRSHLTRLVYVFLPPQYFQASYRAYRFPVVELMEGSPGEPQDWINVAGGTRTLVQLVRAGQAAPAVFVIPDANGARNVDLQCLNQAGGPQDLTYLAVDVPDAITRLFRVQPPGRAWGIAGYSSGGYCAANMGLQFRTRYGFVGVLSGYFTPGDNQFGNPLRTASPFGGNYALKIRNDPLDYLETLPAGTVIPQFWIGAGTSNPGDLKTARLMSQGFRILQSHVTLTLTPGAGHTMATWRQEIPVLFRWMTDNVAAAAATAPQAH